MGRRKQYARMGDFEIDLPKLIKTKLLIQANSGGGKSFAIRKLVEEAYGFCQIIVIDPEGEFFTLRESFDFVLAAPNSKEAKADIHTAKLLATRLLELGANAIVDIYELGTQKQLFVQRFLEALTHAPRELWHPLLVIIDEAHMFAPEGSQAPSKAAMTQFMSLSRKRGFGVVLATQRIAKLDKDAAAEACNNKMIGRCAIDVDQKRSAEELGLTHKQDAREMLRKLEPGQFQVFGPAISDSIKLVRVGAVITTHIEAGEAHKYKPPAPSAKIKAVLGELKDLADQADEEARTIADWKTKYNALQVELREAKRTQPKPTEIKTVEKIVVKPKLVMRIEKAVMRGNSLLERLAKASSEFADGFSEINVGLKLAIGELTTSLAMIKRQDEIPTPRYDSARHEIPTTKEVTITRRRVEPGESISDGQLRVLQVVSQFGAKGIGKTSIQALTGYKTSTRNEYLRKLALAGFVELQGDNVTATPLGRATAPVDELPRGAKLREWWLSKLPDGEGKILKLLIDSYPLAIDKPTIDTRTGYKISTRNEYLRKLGHRKLVEETSDGVRVVSELFQE